MTVSVCVLSTFPWLLPSMCQALCGVVLRRLKSAGISRALRMFRSNCSSASEGTSSQALERNRRFSRVIDINRAVWIPHSCIPLISHCSLICITGMHYNSIWFDQRLVDHNGAGVSHLSNVQQNKTATSSYFSCFYQILACSAATISPRKCACWQNFYGFWCYLSKTDSSSFTHH